MGYEEGECVWAKYKDYPWWPGQIHFVSKRKRARSKRSSLSVKWFGDFPVKTNECKMINIIPWDPEDKDRIYPDVDDQDLPSFNDATDECNTVHLRICEERGIEPTETRWIMNEPMRQKQTKKTAKYLIWKKLMIILTTMKMMILRRMRDGVLCVLRQRKKKRE